MSSEIQNLARCLAAAGFVTRDKTDTSLLYENKNKLVEKVWNGTEFTDQFLVASNVKSSTPALYRVTSDEVCQFASLSSKWRFTHKSTAQGLLHRQNQRSQMLQVQWKEL